VDVDNRRNDLNGLGDVVAGSEPVEILDDGRGVDAVGRECHRERPVAVADGDRAFANVGAWKRRVVFDVVAHGVAPKSRHQTIRIVAAQLLHARRGHHFRVRGDVDHPHPIVLRRGGRRRG